MSKELGISPLEIEELKKIGKYTKENLTKIHNGYPVQYIIGYVNFYGLKINVNENTLIPRYETEYLIEKTIKYIKNLNIENPKILDICTGTGCIGLTLKHELPNADITLSDISKNALEVANQNKKELNLNVKIIESNFFENIIDDYDIIISNPPYVMENEQLPKNVTYEPKIALFSPNNGTYHIEEILQNAKQHLKDKFLIAFEINEQSEHDLTKIIKKYFNNITYKFENDLAGKIRYLFIIKNN